MRLRYAACEKIAIQILLATGEASGNNLGVRVIHGRAQIVVTLIFQRHYVARSRITEHRANLCAVHPIVTVKYARLRRYDKTCHNARTIAQNHFFVNSQKINFTLVLTKDNF